MGGHLRPRHRYPLDLPHKQVDWQDIRRIRLYVNKRHLDGSAVRRGRGGAALLPRPVKERPGSEGDAA
ncbi:hypothetical protein SDC9_165879 [bioreactor metagenome]|uniref:Uncharacterized protein n=1 Tax=bioreactor metagenome TaxID=1076179 RepID=A0A645FY16_9ZZZZ